MTDALKGTPTQYQAICEIGNHKINDVRAPGVHQWTCGWVMQREGGGGHGISLPQRANRWACRYCVEQEIKGHTAQQSMFGAAI
jgi:hypothetical protein